jgi:hypothetical protein
MLFSIYRDISINFYGSVLTFEIEKGDFVEKNDILCDERITKLPVYSGNDIVIFV